MTKRGYFFSLDAFIASAVIILGIILVTMLYTYRPYETQTALLSHDIINTISSVRIIQLGDNDYVNSLIENGNITNPHNTILQQIGEFCYLHKYDLAEQFIDNVVFGIIPEVYSVQLLIIDRNYILLRKTRESESDSSSRVLVSAKSIIFGSVKTSEEWGPYTGEIRIWY